ncbi:PRKDC [Bugula neritina]|uniref:PRKDC n=1 Tax=Bugula neritina TaxID=10212 RepID=A0A7J7J2B3_BUGNE|nr:PRKDC [Bugula neritina]
MMLSVHYWQILSKLCLQDVTTESSDIVISNAFDQKLGILSFLRSISAKQVLRRSISDSLDFIQSLIKKFGTQLKSFVKNIQEVCLQVYTVATVAELKCRALSTISEMLKTELATYCNDLLSVAKKLTSDFAKSDTHVKPTVKKEILVLLGQFCSCSPSSMSEISDSLAEKIISTLQYQMNRSRAPETAIISGCFLSLGYLLGPFDRSGYPDQVNTIFTCLAKGIDSSIKTTRYDIPKSALELMAKHGEQFRNHLLQNYEILYTRLREFTLMNNPEVKKIAMSATETFLRQVGAELADPWDDSLTEEKQRNIFGFFLKDFVTLMKSTSSNLRSVSQAIRSFGYFAAAFKKFQGEGEVRDMLTILLEKCIQVCTTEDETADSKAAFLPSFLQSLANIVKQIDMIDDGISESLTGIFSLTLNAYPTLAGAIHQSCTSAIIQFVYTICSMTQKPVRLLSDLVYQVLLRTCMHDPVIEGESLSILSEDGNKKISYKDYTQLWADLLSPRKYTAAIGITGVSSLENVVYGEMVKGLFRICDKLDLSTSSASVELEEGGENIIKY